jgi:DNA-directed RNA polymerase specialized sigma24 family protein
LVCARCPRRKLCRRICPLLESKLPKLSDNVNHGHVLSNVYLGRLVRLRLNTKTLIAMRGALKGRELYAFRLFYDYALSFKMISRRMRVSERRVYQLLESARRRIRRVLDRQREES